MRCLWLLCNLMLQHWYTQDNQTWFDGRLPTASLYWYHTEGEALAYTYRYKGKYIIVFDKKYFRAHGDELRGALHHEECHLLARDFEVFHDQVWRECATTMQGKGAEFLYTARHRKGE